MVALVDKSSSVGYKPEASWIISTLGCRSESYPFTYHYQCHEIPQWNLEGHGWIGWKSGGIRVVIAPLSPKKTTTICDKLYLIWSACTSANISRPIYSALYKCLVGCHGYQREYQSFYSIICRISLNIKSYMMNITKCPCPGAQSLPVSVYVKAPLKSL